MDQQITRIEIWCEWSFYMKGDPPERYVIFGETPDYEASDYLPVTWEPGWLRREHPYT